MKKIPFLLLILLSFLISEEELQTETYQFSVEDIKQLDVSIECGVGELEIEANPNQGQIEGNITYHPYHTSPSVDYKSFGKKGKLKVKVVSNKEWENDREQTIHIKDWIGIKNDDLKSKTIFLLPQKVPTDIKLELGLGEAEIDLSNLTLSNLDLECGLSEVKLVVRTPNPVRCRKVSIESGLGDFNVEGLGNLRPDHINIEVGLGSAYIDLTGEIVDDIEGNIEVGLGDIDLILPKNANVELDIEKSFLSDVDVAGLIKRDDKWVSHHWDKNLPTIELKISVGLGDVDVNLRGKVTGEW